MNDILGLPDIWYHGTHNFNTHGIMESGIDLTRSRPLLDFGPGFYLTSNFKQAVKQARKVTDIYNDFDDQKFQDTEKKQEYAQGSVITYTINLEELSKTNRAVFSETDMDWALFILGNRLKKNNSYKIHNKDQRFDCVYGPLADGYDIPILLSDFKKGRINEGQFLMRISRYEFPHNNQLSIHTERALSCLVYREVTEIETPQRQSS